MYCRKDYPFFLCYVISLLGVVCMIQNENQFRCHREIEKRKSIGDSVFSFTDSSRLSMFTDGCCLFEKSTGLSVSHLGFTLNKKERTKGKNLEMRMRTHTDDNVRNIYSSKGFPNLDICQTLFILHKTLE